MGEYGYFIVNSLTQCIDAVSKCKQGSVDVGSFYHSFPAILEIKKSFSCG